ncbi:MAG: chromosome segregation SMC family protein, partial [Thermodesulfobacteriota bacterium]
MRIKSLELIGFKSFYDKTKIELSNGINAVVGPNGCGKSNIIDAIRWVLGEQSPKMLRAESMDELISNGTDVLKPYGMTEVSMVVENLPGLGFEEVNIKRRLFRSGESEYYINGVKSRLKDITELFLDTGAGVRGYSIIGQGKVEEFITAKPEEKRRLIEEVAGVVKYKTRRKETNSRIESTRENLSRISDMKSEVLRQMESLSRQAEKADEYKKLNEELRTLEIKILNAKSSTLEADKRNLLQKKSELEREISQLKEQKDIKNSVLNEAEVQSSNIDQSINEIEEELYSLKTDITEKRSFIEFVSKEGLSIDEFINKLKKEITTLENDTNHINETINKKKTDLQQSETEDQNIQSQLSLKVKELEDLKVESVNNKEELDQTKKVLFEILNNYSSVKGSAVGINKELEELTLRRERVEKDKSGLAEINNHLSDKRQNLEVELRNLKTSKITVESDKSDRLEKYNSSKNRHNELTDSTNRIRE